MFFFDLIKISFSIKLYVTYIIPSYLNISFFFLFMISGMFMSDLFHVLLYPQWILLRMTVQERTLDTSVGVLKVNEYG